MSFNKNIKISLSKPASENTIKMIQELKEMSQFCKVTRMELISTIVEIFYQHYFEQNKKEFLKKYLDEKSLIIDLVTNADPTQDLEKLIQEKIREIKSTKSNKKIVNGLGVASE